MTTPLSTALRRLRTALVVTRASSTSSRDAAAVWGHSSKYKWFLPIQTRWKDNDRYGHVNNAVYHSMFDTVINVYLIRYAGLDMSSTASVGFMVHSECSYMKPASYPEPYMAGLSVSRLGTSSVDYRLALFNLKPDRRMMGDLTHGHFPGDTILQCLEVSATCVGAYTHVFVSTGYGNKPTPIRDRMRSALLKLQIDKD